MGNLRSGAFFYDLRLNNGLRLQWNPALRSPRYYAPFLWPPDKTAIHQFPVKKWPSFIQSHVNTANFFFWPIGDSITGVPLFITIEVLPAVSPICHATDSFSRLCSDVTSHVVTLTFSVQVASRTTNEQQNYFYDFYLHKCIDFTLYRVTDFICGTV